MIGGNISNRTAPTLLVDFDTLFRPIKRRPLDKLIKGKPKYKIDVVSLDFFMRTYLKSDYKLDLVIDIDTMNKHTKEYKEKQDLLEREDIPYGGLHFLSYSDVYNLINSGCYMCYISDNINCLLNVGHTHCYTIKEADKFI